MGLKLSNELNIEKIGNFMEGMRIHMDDLIDDAGKRAIEVLKFIYEPLDQDKLYRAALLAACRHFDDRKYTPTIVVDGEFRATGNVSLRTDDGKILIKPSGEYFYLIGGKDFILIDFEGNKLEGVKKPSIETDMHLSIYQKRPDVNAVIHTHPVCTTIYSNYHDKIALDHRDGYEIQSIPFYEPGSQELAKHTSDALRSSDAVILKKHGLVAVGENLTKPLNLTEEIEAEASIEVLGMYRGKQLTEEEAKKFELCYFRFRW